jgi:hypothetical protein
MVKAHFTAAYYFYFGFIYFTGYNKALKVMLL